MRDIRTLHYIEAFDHMELVFRWLEVWAQLENLKVVCHIQQRYQGPVYARWPESEWMEVSSPGQVENWQQYLNRMVFDRRSTVVIGTVGRRPEWFEGVAKHPRLMIVIHNVNYWRRRVRLRDIFTAPAFLQFLRDTWFRKTALKLLQGASCLLVPVSGMSIPLKQFVGLQPVKTVLFAAASIANASAISEMWFDIVIPGTVQAGNRDYESVIVALHLVKPSRKLIRIHLAGRCICPAFIKRIAALIPVVKATETKAMPVQIVIYPEGLTQDAYDKLLFACDVIIGPFKEYYHYGPYREVTGSTRMSGAVSDAVYYRKPLIVPAWYLDEDVTIVTYRGETELAELMSGENSSDLPVAQQRSGPDLVAIWANLIAGKL